MDGILIQIPSNPERVGGRGLGDISRRVVQRDQTSGRNCGLAARRHGRIHERPNINIMVLLHSLDLRLHKACSAHSPGSAKVSRGGDYVDVVVKLKGETVVERSDNGFRSGDVLVDVVVGSEHLVSDGDGDNYGDPVACASARHFVNTVVGKPGVDGVDGFWVWGDECVDVFLGQMCTISV